MRFPSLLWFALIAALPLSPAGSAHARHKVYVVLYEVSVDSNGQVGELKVDKVLDPSLATGPDDAMNHPVQMTLPDSYLAAVRAFLNRRGYEPGQEKFFTYTFFDPSRPEEPNPSPH